jgi:hypothetical protein
MTADIAPQRDQQAHVHAAADVCAMRVVFSTSSAPSARCYGRSYLCYRSVFNFLTAEEVVLITCITANSSRGVLLAGAVSQPCACVLL